MSFLRRAAPLVAVMGLLAFALPAAAQDTPHFITLNYWPVDAPYNYVLDYPDTAWTRDFLGLNPGKGCPPYLIHDRDKAMAYWRDPAIPEDADWEQASHGNRWVSCYRGHAGTDIYAPPYAPVYAAADGDVVGVEPGRDDKGANAVVIVKHHREIAGFVADWIVRYVHLENNFPVISGRVVEGQLIGYVASRGTNTHLHFEMKDLWDCQSPCIVNPWGPTFYFFDDDHNRLPDPAPSILRAAPRGVNLVGNGDFAQGWTGWMALSGVGESIQVGALSLARPAAGARYAGVQQMIPYALPAGTAFEISLTLANPSIAPQSVWVSLRDARGFDRQVGGAFYLPAGSPAQVYRVRGAASEGWANLALLISAGNASGSAVTVNHIAVRVSSVGGDPATVAP